MKGKAIPLAFCIGLVFLSCVWAEEEKFSIQGRYWMPSFSTTLRVGDSVSVPTKVDEDILDLKRKNFLDLTGSFRVAEKHTIRLGYTPISYKGDAVITETIRFGDQVFAAGNYVESSLKLDYLRAAWLFRLLDNKKGLRFTGIFEAKGYLAKASLEAPQQRAKHTYKLRVPVPAVGGLLEADITKGLRAYAEATGITAGSRGYLIDAEGGIKWSAHRNFEIEGGYRAYSVKFEKSDDYFKLKIGGPYVGLRVLF